MQESEEDYNELIQLIDESFEESLDELSVSLEDSITDIAFNAYRVGFINGVMAATQAEEEDAQQPVEETESDSK